MPTVTVCTQVYNTAAFLPQCIESVLNQTFPDFEYIIVDNGCTDGSQDILKRYAEQDSRIKLIRFEENVVKARWIPLVREIGSGEYLTNLDSDDWMEPNFLQNMIQFAQIHDLDVACTGTVMHIMQNGMQSLRKIEHPLILQRESFASALPWYHVFCRTIWAKLIRMNCMRKAKESSNVVYGGDTIYCFQLLRCSQRIGIDSSILHHYRIHPRSTSYQYDPKRFDADIYLYNDTIDFLSVFGPISVQNKNFLQCVYSNAVIDTTGVIQNSSLSPAGKLREYRTIATHSITLAAYRECTDESANRSKTDLIVKALEAGAGLEKADDEDLRLTMQTLLPHCGRAVSAANVRMFLEDRKLLQALLQDDADKVLENLLSRAEQNQGVKKYGIPAALQALTADNILLCQINDAVFLRKYAEIYKMVWKGERLAALDKMAGLLLEGKANSGQETFLTLFVALAAVENQPEAFVFGKLQLGKLYLRQNRLTECRLVADELEEMGLTDSEELKELRKGCENL